MTEYEKMVRNEIYKATDPDISRKQMVTAKLIRKYNKVKPAKAKKRLKILKKVFGFCSDLTVVQSDFHCDCGFNIFTQGLAVIHSSCVFEDTSRIEIGDGAVIGSGTVMACTGFPLDAGSRRQLMNQSLPIILGKDVWIGANCTILGGVTIGDGAVIRPGTVVAEDVPECAVVAGNPGIIQQEAAVSGNSLDNSTDNGADNSTDNSADNDTESSMDTITGSERPESPESGLTGTNENEENLFADKRMDSETKLTVINGHSK
ncbi:MAG: DapH/DapD/GlmU-related protein [Eubacteriaceae bacterium]|jgi:acetyltransferase-like isoleucine patch superfamily enzyme